MLTARDLMLGALLPGLISLVLWLLTAGVGRRLGITAASQGPALSLATLAGWLSLWGTNLLRAQDITNRLGWLVFFAGAAGLAGARCGRPFFIWSIRAILALGTATALQWPELRQIAHGGEFAPSLERTAMATLLLSLLMLTLLALTGRRTAAANPTVGAAIGRLRSAWPAALLALLTGTWALMLMLTGSLKLGQMQLALCAALVGAAAGAMLIPAALFPPARLAATTAATALLLSGCFYASLPWWMALLLLAGWACALLALDRQDQPDLPRARRVLTVALLCASAIFTLAPLALAVRDFQQAAAP